MKPLALTKRNRVILSGLIGVLYAALVAWLIAQIGPHSLGRDFTYPWLAGRFVSEGLDPYRAIKTAEVPLTHDMFYPLTAGILTLPFAWLSARVAAVLFMGFAAAGLAYGLTCEGWWRLGLFLAAPAYIAADGAQWSPALTAAALSPALLFIALAKPNLGLPLLAYQRPNRWTVRQVAIAAFVGAGIVVASFLILPSWPVEMRAALSGANGAGMYGVPILTLWGIPLVLAAVAWRTREARLLLVLACVPQSYSMYDQLPLMLVARNRREQIALAVCSWLAYVAYASGPIHPHSWLEARHEITPFLMGGLYYPALLVVLRHRSDLVPPVDDDIHRVAGSC